MTNEDFRQLALSFPGTEEAPHFERRAFKVTGKRIFATLLEQENTANLKLSLKDQQVFCEYGEEIYPVPNKWGEQGWTTFELPDFPGQLMLTALEAAYNDVVKARKK